MDKSSAKSAFLDSLKAGALPCGLTETRALLAISGGADSVAMFRGLIELRAELRLELRAAHLNHNLRGEESDADSRWIRELCADLGVPLTTGAADVASLAQSANLGIEETARKVRYDFLLQSAEATGCSCVAVAHTADDQSETILHHIVRGTGFDGLCGMPRRRPLDRGVALVRPLLEIGRPAVAAYLDAIGQEFRRDATNDDPRFTRSRIRHSLLPQLRREFNPQVDDALRRLGRQAAEVRETLDRLAADLLAASLEDRQADVCRLNCEALAPQPRHVVRECFNRLWKEQNWPRRRMGFAEWDLLAELAAADKENTATLPGDVGVCRRGKLLILRRR